MKKDPKLQAILDMQDDIPDVDIDGLDENEIDVSTRNGENESYIDYLLGEDNSSDNTEYMKEFSEMSGEDYID